MTRKEFIGILDREDYSYEIEGDKIIVTHNVYVFLASLTSLPPGVVFNNVGDVHLGSLITLPPGVEFNNVGDVLLTSLETISHGVVFRNSGDIYLKYLTSLPPGVEFKNGGDVYLESLFGGCLKDWRGNIEGIDSKRLLNKMISLGLFER